MLSKWRKAGPAEREQLESSLKADLYIGLLRGRLPKESRVLSRATVQAVRDGDEETFGLLHRVGYTAVSAEDVFEEAVCCGQPLVIERLLAMRPSLASAHLHARAVRLGHRTVVELLARSLDDPLTHPRPPGI